MTQPSAADFIEVYPDALSREQCATLVARFNASGETAPPVTEEPTP